VEQALLARIEFEMVLLLRRSERGGPPNPASPFTGILDRSAYLLLDLLETHGPQNINTLADHLGLAGSTVTRQVVALEQAGHARRARDPRDGRAVVVQATAKGLTQLTMHRQRRVEMYAQILRDWPQPDRQALAVYLDRLNRDLDEYRRRAITDRSW
jgi:DNA-binding MarR family transcriptional regulator